jgi:predicted RNA-binding Zn ribbon-like protein
MEALQEMDPTEAPDRLVRLAVDLVNLPDDRLDAAGLARFMVDHGESEPVELGAAEVDSVLAIRAELSELFDAAGEGVDAVAARINWLLDRAQTPPRLSNHDGTHWHLHVNVDEASWSDWLAATTGLGLARLLVEDGVARIGRCAAPSCRSVFAGGPRNHPRRYCSPACANRGRVAAFRARRRPGS